MKRLAFMLILCILFFSLQPEKQVSAWNPYNNTLFTEFNDYVACDGIIHHAIYATKHSSTAYMQGYVNYYVNEFFEETRYFPETTGYIDEEIELLYPDSSDKDHEAYVMIYYYPVSNGHGTEGTWLDSYNTLTATCPPVDPDTSPPTTPSNLRYLSLENSRQINWDASNDDFYVYEYHVYNHNVYIGSTTGTSYSFPNSNYPGLLSVTVIASDYEENLSAASEPLLVVGDLQYNYVNGRLMTITYKNTDIVLYQYTYDNNGNLRKVEAP